MHIDTPSLVVGILIGLLYAYMIANWKAKP